MDRVKHVSLDFWHTLGEPNPAYGPVRVELMAQAFGTTPEAASSGYKALKRAWEEAAVTTGVVPGELELLHHFNQHFGTVLTAHKFRHLRMDLRAAFTQNPPAICGLVLQRVAELASAGITASITSNTNFIIGGDCIAPLLGPAFKFKLWSDQLGFCKPGPRIFQVLQQAAAVPAASILHVGDHPRQDYEAALAAGMQATLCGPELPAAKILKTLCEEFDCVEN